MYTEFDLRQVPLTLRFARKQAENFLTENGLRLDELDYLAAIYPLDGDEMLACGGHKGNLMKCIATSDKLRDTGMSARLISHLVNLIYQQGYSSAKLFTKPENEAIFKSMGFSLLARSGKAILMENSLRPLQEYCSMLQHYRKEGVCGAIVMNANPFTLGHRYLIEQASAQVDWLFVLPVKEDRSTFSYSERRAMIASGCGDLKNVEVLEGSEYSISEFTFPTYFLKDLNDAADTHITLDLDLFSTHIAPALGITKRLVGSEPKDPLTHRYNELMHQLLPQHGIEVVEIERTCLNNNVVSASSLRKEMGEGHYAQAARLAYPTTRPYLLAHIATMALQEELDTTPKPGLVDQHDNGAHHDMDHPLMTLSINTLHPYLVQLAQLGYQSQELPDVGRIKAIGIEAEEAMMSATHGVNTHRGALFSMGLTVCAAAWMESHHQEPNAKQLQDTVQTLANLFPHTSHTHGSDAVGRYGIKGALATAQEGYKELYDSWLPFYFEHQEEAYANQKLLLRIMCDLDDTNIYHRCGSEVAQQVKQESQQLLENFSLQALEMMGERYTRQNISPGGSADMLSLTLFVARFTKK